MSCGKYCVLWRRCGCLLRADGLGWKEFQKNKVIDKSLFFLLRQMGNGAELWEHITRSGPDVPWQRGTRLDSGFSTLLTIAPTPWPSGLSPCGSQSKSPFSDAFMLKTKSIPWGLITSSAGIRLGKQKGNVGFLFAAQITVWKMPSRKWTRCLL